MHSNCMGLRAKGGVAGREPRQARQAREGGLSGEDSGPRQGRRGTC